MDDLLDYATSQSGGGFVSGTNLFAGSMPDRPTEATALYETGGLASEHLMGNAAGQAVVERPGLQVVCRAASYQVARRNAQKAYLLFDGLPKRLINGVQYHWGAARQSPFLMGRDANNMFLVACNYDVVKAMSTTS